MLVTKMCTHDEMEGRGENCTILAEFFSLLFCVWMARVRQDSRQASERNVKSEIVDDEREKRFVKNFFYSFALHSILPADRLEPVLWSEFIRGGSDSGCWKFGKDIFLRVHWTMHDTIHGASTSDEVSWIKFEFVCASELSTIVWAHAKIGLNWRPPSPVNPYGRLSVANSPWLTRPCRESLTESTDILGINKFPIRSRSLNKNIYHKNCIYIQKDENTTSFELGVFFFVCAAWHGA